MKGKEKSSNKKRAEKELQIPLLFLHSCTQLVTLRGGAGPRRGAELSELAIIEDGAVLIRGEKIIAVGTTDELAAGEEIAANKRDVIDIDCDDKVVIPGFVDAHTHPVFAAPRLVDFEKRISGASYEEIAAAGGGIRSSIAAVRGASEAELAEHALDAFREMAVHGTTTVEAKSGYGLSVESELKSLRAIRRAAKQFRGTVIATLLGAHVPPPEFKGREDEYVAAICEQMIPEAAKENLAEFVDVFCDRGAFTIEQSARIFEAARLAGLGIRAHVCQLTESKLDTFFAANPASLDHMDHVSDADVAALAKLDTVATLVPGANYFLNHAYPPARKLIDAGVAVALATDFNPGSSPTPSMPFVLSLATTQMKMSPAEALAAATINAAHSLHVADRKGSIEVGKDADLAIFDAEDYRELAYWFGTNRCAGTMMRGEFLE